MLTVYSFIFLALCVPFISSFNLEELDDKYAPCGLYGFRCLDKKRAQMCDEKDVHDVGTPRPRIFECADGLICDEEKQQYCSPAPSTCSCSEKSQQKRKAGRFRKKTRNDIFDDNFGPTITQRPMTTVDDDDDQIASTSEFDSWNGRPPIMCTTHGFHSGMFLLTCVPSSSISFISFVF